MMRILLLAAVLLLSACASQAPLPAHTPELALPLQLHIQRKQAGQWQDWLLVLQREDAGLRWSLLDPLGIPLARQRLVDGQWQADGLLPPNPEARELFAALLFALAPAAGLHDNYPAAQEQSSQRTLGQRWRVDYRQPLDFDLELGADLHYRIRLLNTGEHP